MRRIMLKSKIHRATVTGARVDYEGSITIDGNLMRAADILEYEQVHVLDITNGRRLVTYAIPGGAGEICINGAAARLIDVGDTVIILSYGGLVPKEWDGHRPAVVKVDDENRIIDVNAPAAGGRLQESHPHPPAGHPLKDKG
ncbi:MAG: aspartate 1-decarboxylase [Thermoleophilia bacterium]|nr:aspartate 1-decarboxylase [Thermoleophilia bacterium]